MRRGAKITTGIYLVFEARASIDKNIANCGKDVPQLFKDNSDPVAAVAGAIGVKADVIAGGHTERELSKITGASPKTKDAP